MTAIKHAFDVEQGATFYFTFQVRQGVMAENGQVVPGNPKDLTGCEFRMQVRTAQHVTPLFSASNDTAAPPIGGASGFIFGIDETEADDAIPDLTNGWVRLRISDDDTDLFSVKTALYDIEMEEPSGRVHRLYQGTVITDPNITQVVPDDPIVEA